MADRGIGIPEGEREQIFERYYRGRNAAGITGTGVGLYFVKMVVDLHGGAVTAQSREGGGSRFTVWLPREPAPSFVPRWPEGDSGPDSKT
ncbi:MAG: sensor histidine kinase [Steroidobacteraceae bacterium]